MTVACTLLADTQRRYLLYQLAETEEGYGDLDSLTAQIAAWERERPVDEIDEEEEQRAYISLVHNHLPRLADYDVIEYDLRSGDVVLADGFDDLESLLKQFKQTEEVPEVRSLNVF